MTGSWEQFRAIAILLHIPCELLSVPCFVKGLPGSIFLIAAVCHSLARSCRDGCHISSQKMHLFDRPVGCWWTCHLLLELRWLFMALCSYEEFSWCGFSSTNSMKYKASKPSSFLSTFGKTIDDEDTAFHVHGSLLDALRAKLSETWVFKPGGQILTGNKGGSHILCSL